ncbi:hypothetical protein CCACVL1_18044 [Corchorus capsularis]|uniref:Uncharacterized protein n=1 Tax=Corchorus capsularis TaxID=210143 RepID=A0A1R3HNE1_COCAP|nr:hypothetical protein CCACVL1_18044 [Corchorus capsularis]
MRIEEPTEEKKEESGANGGGGNCRKVGETGGRSGLSTMSGG